MKKLFNLMDENIKKLEEIVGKLPEVEYICPYCDYKMDEDEADSTCDCGCPSCRKIIDWEF